jgi:hypothetical protein
MIFKYLSLCNFTYIFALNNEEAKKELTNFTEIQKFANCLGAVVKSQISVINI